MATADPSWFSVRIESEDLEAGALEVYALRGREAISELFEFEIEAVTLSETRPVAGTAVAIVFVVQGEPIRRVHGIVAEVVDRFDAVSGLAGSRAGRSVRALRLRVVPRAHQLRLVHTHDVYLDASAVDLARLKLSLVGLGDDDVSVTVVDPPRAREFVVQYREDDLSFVRRLLEHEGISFFFDHTEDRDRVVLTDYSGGFPPLGEGTPIHYHPGGEERGVYSLHEETRIVPADYLVYDYNERTPALDISGTYALETGFAGGIFEYGGDVKTPDEAGVLARVRAGELESTRRTFAGEATVPSLEAGRRVALDGHPAIDEELVITSVSHEATLPVFGRRAASDVGYRCSFRAVPASVRFRPPRVTPRPRISGVLPGVVQAPPGTAPNGIAPVDEHGRYLVRFYFDTRDRQGERASLPVRFAQLFAGPSYGTHFPLRTGTEVLVAFVDGDPDRPLIVGAVHNTTSPSPVVRKSATKNRIRTASGILIEFDDGG